ncbi:hypothetical protein [Heyndrickxia coagulans]|uniref:hypothetical protein n=1 Tax=Heyndrickxia coagulans TaxID=1398 RepID=UPI000CE2B53E|nr:hypothetical protein [Heyndrickxia coagulans]AVD55299.1 hypothetical protein C3766_03715 [Heyndrickxia coagulans]AWP36171.1 hypothetical protein CYJ15_03840 [Heyndrickxia coagulans]QDI61673.1 hypothetical protein DXF96_09390 [Heyndrickxia coagulans]
MKKIWFATFSLALVLALGACSGNSGQSGAKKPAKSSTKTALMNFYMNLTNHINAQDRDLNTYEQAIAKTDDKPPKTELSTMQKEAQSSAENVVKEIKNTKIPSKISSYQSEIKTAVKDLQQSYQMKADELKKTNPSLDAANKKLEQANDELGKVFKKAGLSPASLPNDVNS